MIRQTYIRFFGILVIVAIGFLNFASAEDAAGKKVFLANKCQTCHSIDSQGIKKTLASSKAPDLSNIGSVHKADWLVKYINKEEALKDKKHMKAWTGTKEDLQTVAKWLETLKTAEKK